MISAILIVVNIHSIMNFLALSQLEKKKTCGLLMNIFSPEVTFLMEIYKTFSPEKSLIKKQKNFTLNVIHEVKNCMIERAKLLFDKIPKLKVCKPKLQEDKIPIVNFQRLSAYSDRIDILFDNYLTDSIKAGERKRRSRMVGVIKTNIQNIDQQLSLLSEMPKFRACPENKIAFRQFFIQWITDMYEGDKPIYLEGCHGNGGK